MEYWYIQVNTERSPSPQTVWAGAALVVGQSQVAFNRRMLSVIGCEKNSPNRRINLKNRVEIQLRTDVCQYREIVDCSKSFFNLIL